MFQFQLAKKSQQGANNELEHIRNLTFPSHWQCNITTGCLNEGWLWMDGGGHGVSQWDVIDFSALFLQPFVIGYNNNKRMPRVRLKPQN